MSEMFPLVDSEGRVIGSAPREECHGNPELLHPVVHCVIVNARGELLLQLRSVKKDIQPGKWDTSVGGHVALGEKPEDALVREVCEEVGAEIDPKDCTFLHTYINSNRIESELVYTWLVEHEGPFTPQESEVDQLRFWSVGEISSRLEEGIFTPNFIDEFNRLLSAGAVDGRSGGCR